MERQRQSRVATGGPGGPASGVDISPVTVCHGPYSEQLPVAGMTVGEVRVRYSDRFDLDPLSQAIVDGQEAGEDTVLGSGQMLSFIRRAGEKGIAPAAG